jgi:hypothetical protein
MDMIQTFEYPKVIDEICHLDWQSLDSKDMMSVAWAYYYFSVQFRESLKTARTLYPTDEKLIQLEREECNTDNLSPWPGVVDEGEKVNHDEFMRRTLELFPIESEKSAYFTAIGEIYLANTRKLDAGARAASIASYEDGGLERVFKSILRYSRWNNDLLRAFEHFLAEHVRFDSDPDQGHGALSRHIPLDDRVLPLWQGFRDLFIACVPKLSGNADITAGTSYEHDGAFDSFPIHAESLDARAPVHEGVGD